MRVIAKYDFHDNLMDVDRKRGEEFIVTRERYEEINAVGMEKIGSPIVEITYDDPEPKMTPKKRASSAKAARKKKEAK